MTAMKLAGAAWAYVGASLSESAAILQALGVQAMDLIAAPGALLDSREIERDPQGQARRVIRGRSSAQQSALRFRGWI